MIKPTQTGLAKAADSQTGRSPSTTVQTAPIPVYTAYAVPHGRHLAATPNNPMLIAIMIAVPTDHQSRVKPCEYFSPYRAYSVSNSPATNKDRTRLLLHPFLFPAFVATFTGGGTTTGLRSGTSPAPGTCCCIRDSISVRT